MEFSSTGGMRSPFSPRVRASIAGSRNLGLNSAKKSQGNFMATEQPAGDVIYKTPSMTIETYGAPLPVLVTETLAFASGDVSVRMSSCGWCWLVAGRRVLAWPMETSTPGVPTAARELTLPQTDLAHKADLVMIFYEEGAQMASCVGVSPEGVVRYWASVGAEGQYVDVACELAGQECDRLAAHPRLPHLLLATTTCTLLTLTLAPDREGRVAPVCAVVRAAGGWLGGLGRRVSHLFWGAMPAHTDAKLVGLVVLEGSVGEGVGVGEDEEGGGATVALVAGGPVLQLWRGERLREHHLRRPLLEALARAHLLQGEVSSVEVTALEAHACGAGLVLLLAAAHVARAPDLRHALVHIVVDSAGNARVGPLWGVRAPREPRCLPLPPPAPAPLLYGGNVLALYHAGGGEPEVVEAREGERVLGAALLHNLPLLFSRRHGLLRLRLAAPDHRSICDSPMDSPCPSEMYDGNLSLYEIDPHEVSAIMTDACGKLKTAFLFHLRRDPAAARLVGELFPRAADVELDSALDRTVLAVVDELLDDVPAGDPRWRSSSGSSRVALGSSAALSVPAQLRDKTRALSLWLDFLRAQQLWPRLTRLTTEDGSGTESTVWALCARGARLAGARALHRAAAGAAAALVDAALAAAAEEGPGAGEGLTGADEGWRRVSRLPRVLRALAHLPPPAEPRAAALHALHTLNTLNTVLGEMHKWIAQWQQWAGPGPLERGPPDAALLTALSQLHERVLTQTARRSEPTLRAQLGEACAALAELLLVEAEPWRRADRPYRRLRAALLRPYVDEGQIERAAVLAEKFKDFELLVDICINQNDMERLNNYIEKYANEGMAETAFGTLWSRGGWGRAALVRALGGARLELWLRALPPRRPLLALLALARPPAAAPLLADLADAERGSLQRMTTMASLAKLCLASAEPAPAEAASLSRALEARLALAEQHAALPKHLRHRHGLEGDTRVYDPEELVQMYVEDEGGSLTEVDYKRALELTEFVADMERRDELRLRIWCASIKCDDWSNIGDRPEEELQQKTFFRLIELVQLMGGDLEVVLPAAEDVLTARELAELAESARVRYLIQLAYDLLRHDRCPEPDTLAPLYS